MYLDEEPGTEVIKVTANDPDLNPVLTYSFTPSGNPGQMFSIDTYSGRIALAKKLDYEYQKKYVLNVVVSELIFLIVEKMLNYIKILKFNNNKIQNM